MPFARFPLSVLLMALLTSQTLPAADPVAGSASPAPAAVVSRFEKWEPAIRKFEEQDEMNPPLCGGIVFVGSSSIRLWKLDQSFPGLPVINRGFGGSQIIDSVHFADRIVVPYRPRIIAFYAGDNDTAQGKSAAEVTADFQKFADLVRCRLPGTRLLFISIKPSPSRWKLAAVQKETNESIRKICEQNPCLTYVDVWQPMLDSEGQPRAELFVADKLHLSADGYRIWTEAIRPHLLP